MKTLRAILASALFVASFSINAYADDPAKIKDHRTQPDLFFLQEGDLPNSLMLLPAPPDGGSIQFLYDQARYNWGKQQRNTPVAPRLSPTPVSAATVSQRLSRRLSVSTSPKRIPRPYMS